MLKLPRAIASEIQLETLLSEPTAYVINALASVESDLVILGAGGKMGPTLARMASRALESAQSPNKVIAVARYSQPGLQAKLEAWGIQTVQCNLLDREAVASLPMSHHVIFMAGQKFGTSGQEAQTWAMNSYMPAIVAEHFIDAKIVVFSTGNIYPLTPVVQGGSVESDAPSPVGEYAMSCLGRERMFEHFSRTRGLRCGIMRLNYAVEMRYGVLLDVATKVYAGQPVDLSMGAVNVIWQGDANAQALGMLAHCATPPFILNVTGPETISLRRLAERFGEILGREPVIVGSESDTALLNNADKAQQLFGYPNVSLNQIIEWTATWVQMEGSTLDKPTHFETRDGNF